MHNAVTNAHLVVENLRFTRLSFGNQSLVQNIKNILTDTLEFCFDLLAVFADDMDVLVRTFRVLFLFNRGDDAP